MHSFQNGIYIVNYFILIVKKSIPPHFGIISKPAIITSLNMVATIKLNI